MAWIFLIVYFLFPVPALAVDPFCAYNSKSNTGINTALGCVPVEMSNFIPWLSTYIFGITGGIAFLMMIYGFFLMTTASGDPKAIAGAQETITAAIQGLLLSVFGVFILRLIALNILQIPGLG